MSIANDDRWSTRSESTDTLTRAPFHDASANIEKPTKALIGLGLLVAISLAMYGLGSKQPGADAPAAQQMARSNIQR